MYHLRGLRFRVATSADEGLEIKLSFLLNIFWVFPEMIC